jgi:hypothetical protein
MNIINNCATKTLKVTLFNEQGFPWVKDGYIYNQWIFINDVTTIQGRKVSFVNM